MAIALARTADSDSAGWVAGDAAEEAKSEGKLIQ